MRRWSRAGGGVALSVAAGLLAVGCTATVPVAGPGRTATTTRHERRPPRRPATADRPRHGRAGASRPAPPRPGSGPAPTAGRSRSAAAPLPCAGHRRRLRRLRRDGRELVVLAGLPWRFPRPGPRPTARRPTPTTPSTARASARRSTGSWAAPASTPATTGPRAEAAAWGARQAARTLADMAKEHVTYPVVFMDIELPGVAPAFDNGWENVYTSPCSGTGEAPRHAGRRWTGPTSTGSGATSAPTRRTRRGSTPPRRSGRRSSAPAAPPRSRTPTNGPTSRRPRTWRRPRTAGA